LQTVIELESYLKNMCMFFNAEWEKIVFIYHRKLGGILRDLPQRGWSSNYTLIRLRLVLCINAVRLRVNVFSAVTHVYFRLRNIVLYKYGALIIALIVRIGVERMD